MSQDLIQSGTVYTPQSVLHGKSESITAATKEKILSDDVREGPDKDTEVVCFVDVVGAPCNACGIPQRRRRIHPFKWTEYTFRPRNPALGIRP